MEKWNIPKLARSANITFGVSQKYHLRFAQISLRLWRNITLALRENEVKL